MEQLPCLVLSHIGSFLNTKETLACNQAAKALKPVCQGVTSHTVKINTNKNADNLRQLLASVFASLPCLKRIIINLNYIDAVTPAPKSINTPGVLIELNFTALCSEMAVDSVIEWFEQEPEVSINRIGITGKEAFLRHPILRLNMSITSQNADVLNNKVIVKIPRLIVTVYTDHLDLSGISVDHNQALMVYHDYRSKFTCTDPWKITDLVYDTLYDRSRCAFDLFESMRQDPMMSKSSRMKQVFVHGDIDIPQLHLRNLLPKSVKWLIQPT